ncbi:Transposase, IS66, partial [mine drainage metagenome]
MVPLGRTTLAEWIGHIGVGLQPLVDALRCEHLTRPVLYADETPVAHSIRATDKPGVPTCLPTPHREVQVSRAQDAQERPPAQQGTTRPSPPSS